MLLIMVLYQCSITVYFLSISHLAFLRCEVSTARVGSSTFLHERLPWSRSFAASRVRGESLFPFTCVEKQQRPTGAPGNEGPMEIKPLGSSVHWPGLLAITSLLEDHSHTKMNHCHHWKTNQVSYSDRWFKLQVVKFGVTLFFSYWFYGIQWPG